MEGKKISIIVPIYKVEKYLKRCVDSLLNQTYHNIEIILVDDGSPDMCGKICDEYAKFDERVVVIHKLNGGLSDARNMALEIVKGDFVMFVDSDDWINEQTCEIVLDNAIRHNADLVVFGVENVYDDGNVKRFPPMKPGKISNSEAIKSLMFNILQFGIFNYACNKLYSKCLFDKIRFAKGRLAEDQGVTYKLFHEAKSIFVCEDTLYYYFQRSGSISKNRFEPQQIVDRTSLWFERLEFVRENYPELEDYQLAQILGDVYISLIKLKGSKTHTNFIKDITEFTNKYRCKEKEYAKINKRLKVHYYCYPLFWLYVKLFVK